VQPGKRRASDCSTATGDAVEARRKRALSAATTFTASPRAMASVMSRTWVSHASLLASWRSITLGAGRAASSVETRAQRVRRPVRISSSFVCSVTT
jgi:hypothetical protein